MDGCMGRDRVERNMGACLVQVLIQGGRVFGTSLVLSTKTYQNVSKRIKTSFGTEYQNVSKCTKTSIKSTKTCFDTL